MNAGKRYLIGLVALCCFVAHGADDLLGEAAKTYRLLARDIAHWNETRPWTRGATSAPKYQPPAEQCFNTEALVHETDRDPLDILLRRSKALSADVAAERAKASVADGEGFSGGDTFSSLVASLDALAAKAAATDIADEDARYIIVGIPIPEGK